MTIEEINGEHKLGAVAHAILALCKSQECNLGFKSQRHLLKLTNGLLIFQDKAKQGFVHVIDKNRKILHDFRTIYYDGEALFALVEAYKKLGYDWILDRAILAAEYFIEQEKWKAHDHWQAYAFCSLYEITSVSYTHLTLPTIYSV